MWSLDLWNSPPLWRPGEAGEAILAFTTRLGGVSATPYDSLNLGRSTGDLAATVSENRRRVLAALGLDPGRLATAGQVHGAGVASVSAPGHTEGCDVLVTRTPALAVAVTSADCLPILFVSRDAVAAAHAGWRGILAGAPRAALAALCAAGGVPPEGVQAHFGPCIRPCCYEVGIEVASQFPDAALSLVGGALRLDLAVAARLQLLEAGLPAGALSDTGVCTACEVSRYYSHRRDAGRTGRHWGIVALRARA